MSDKLRQLFENEAVMQAFKAHCFMDMQHEMCGLFVVRAGALEFVPCDNVAYDRKGSFLIHPAEFVKASDEGDVIAVGHSHVVGTSEPSNEDRVNSENCKLPFVIFQPEVGTVHHYEPTGATMDLIGRQWILGVSDCYSIARDYYKSQGVELKDYVRNELSVLRTESMFLKYFEENDFVEVETPQVHDLLLIQVRADIPNHCAVMVDNNLILHHLQYRLSCREPYGGYWRRHCVKILRHKKWL